MLNTGKSLRMSRILGPDKRSFIFPVDHGIPLGPVKGIENPIDILSCAVNMGVDALLLNPGLAKRAVNIYKGKTALVLRIGAFTVLGPDPSYEIPVIEVEDALALGADAVCITVNIGSQSEPQQLQGMGKISSRCERYGIPYIAEMMLDPKHIKDVYDAEYIAWVARIGEEVGADMLKVHYSGDPKSFKRVVDSVNIPVGIAGGAAIDSEEKLYKMVEGSIQAGAACAFIGRNVFQAENPRAVLRRLIDIVHSNPAAVEPLHTIKCNSCDICSKNISSVSNRSVFEPAMLSEQNIANIAREVAMKIMGK